LVSLTLIRIGIYPVDSAIQLLNNWGQMADALKAMTIGCCQIGSFSPFFSFFPVTVFFFAKVCHDIAQLLLSL